MKRKKKMNKNHIIDYLLTSFARSVRESFAFVLFAQTLLLRRSICTKTSGHLKVSDIKKDGKLVDCRNMDNN